MVQGELKPADHLTFYMRKNCGADGARCIRTEQLS